MRSSNPIFNNNSFSNENISFSTAEMPMTISGTMTKLLLLTLVLLVGAAAVYYQFSLKHFDFVNMIMIVSCIVAFVLALIISFKPKTASYLAPIYAFTEGALISGLSCFFEAAFPGIIIQATSMTMLVVFTMAFLFKIGAIRATEKFRSIILIATVAVGLFYLITFIIGFFNVQVPYFTVNSPLNIGINIVIAGIAALNLILDFDFIERGSREGYPSLFEWYGAFGLLVTIVWLYIEILRLLSRFRSND